MGYKFIDEREPTDEELNQLMTQAIQTVERKKKAALDTFMDSLHEHMQKLKQERKHAAQA